MKAKILYGKPGIGKTFSVEKFALDNDYYLIEYNASDIRTAKQFNNLSSLHSRGASGKKLAYLFDEADNMDRGGYKKLAEFLKGIIHKEIPVFLTANKLDKIPKTIRKICDEEQVFPKTENEIARILVDNFPDMLGFDSKIFIEMTKEASTKCKGDIRKAKQYLLYNISPIEENKLNNLEIVKMILYEEDRFKVFDYVKQIPLSSLYSWLFETFAMGKKTKVVKLLQEVDQNLYKVNEDYLYSFIAFELPVQKERVFERLPMKMKLLKIEEDIVKKLKQFYKCNSKIAVQYLQLMKAINTDKFCLTAISERCNFSKSESEYFGISKSKAKKVEKKIVKTASLLQY